ncbi:MAG: hypothetical protein AAF752_14580 [Bacteroidota bacterium]
MKRTFTHLLTLFALMIATSACSDDLVQAPAEAEPDTIESIDDVAFLQGEWGGTLEYLDYTSERRVSLAVDVNITRGQGEAGDPQFSVRMIFTEPDGRKVGGTSLFAVPESGIVDYNGDRWTVDSFTEIRNVPELVMSTLGQDDNRAATIRTTVRLEDGELTIRKDVQYTGETDYINRNVFTLEK